MPTNHNQAPSTVEALSDSEKRVLTIGTLNEWRTTQYGMLSQLRSNAGPELNDDYVKAFNGSVDSTLEDFLNSKGVDPTSAHYDEIRTLFREASIDNHTEDQWGNSPASRDVDANDHKSQQDVFEERLEAWVGTETSNDSADNPDTEPVASSAEFATLEKELEDARMLWAAESAKRQGRFFGNGGTKHDAIRDDYHAKLQALGRRHMAEHSDYDDESKRVIATAIIFDEQEKLRNLTTEKLQGTKVSKIIEWMNKGGTVKRIGKGLLIGAGAGLAGSFLAGAVGAGIIAGGTIAATRFARGFALKDGDQRGMDRYVEDEQGIIQGVDYRDYDVEDDTSAMSDEERMSAFIDVADNGFNEDTGKEQQKRRKAAMFGTLIMGAGALAGYGIHELSERIADKDLTAWNKFTTSFDEWWNGDNDVVDLTPDSPDSAPDMDGDGIPDADDHDIDGDGVNNGPDDAPRDPDVTDRLDWSDFDRDARFVEYGEGGFQTLEEMGVPQEKWEAVWQDAGTVFNEQGKTYVMDDGRWGWDRPMRMSDADLTVLAEAAERNGVTL